MHKLRQEILFLQLEDSNYMLGKIEAMQTVTYAKLTLCVFLRVSQTNVVNVQTGKLMLETSFSG